MVSTLAMSDAAVKLLIEKSVFTDAEFKAKFGTERANYLASACINANVWPISCAAEQPLVIKLKNYGKHSAQR